MKTKDRATENLLKIALGEAAPTEHLDRRDAMAELLRRLYSQDEPCTDWGEGVETRLESLDDSIDSLSTAHNKVADRVDALEERVGDTALDAPLTATSLAHAKRLNAFREWADRMDEGLDELHDRVAEATTSDGPMPVGQVIDQVAHHAERVSELLEKAMECREEAREEWPGRYAEELQGQAEDYLAAAKIHNQTARALSVVVDHKREAAS